MPDKKACSLDELLKRLKLAKGPDRKLDNIISWYLEDTKWWVAEWGERQDTHSPPRLTESVDDALRFIKRVLPDWDIILELRQGYIWAVVACNKLAGWRGLVGVNSPDTPTAALSLVEAALMALMKKQKAEEWQAKRNPPVLTG